MLSSINGSSRIVSRCGLIRLCSSNNSYVLNKLVQTTRTTSNQIHNGLVVRQQQQHLQSAPSQFIRHFVSVTDPLLERQTMKVPTMGDSITEGTIVEWVADVGQAVSDGDVVALIETDKVTVEIKATTNGVITQHFGKIEETVEVGAALYELDTEATATVIKKTTEEKVFETPTTITDEKSPEPIVAATASSAPIETEEHQLRIPSIHFLGKDGWAKRKSGTDEHHHHDEVQQSTTSSTVATPSTTGASIIIYDDPRVRNPMYGRPNFTELEMEALLLGGASIAPTVIRHSTGAKFKL